jgi:hypothetical protein
MLLSVGYFIFLERTLQLFIYVMKNRVKGAGLLWSYVPFILKFKYGKPELYI